MTVINIFTDLRHAYPYGYWIAWVVIISIFIIVFYEFTSYEHIRCKVIQNKKFRFTDVRRHKKKNTYEIQGLHGKWEPLKEEHIKKIEEIRQKFATRIKHGKHITPEFHLS